MVDLYDFTFWAFVAVAVAVVVPMTRPGLRRSALALIDLGFLAYLLNGSIAALNLVLVGLLAAWLGLRGLAGRARWVVVWLGGLAALGLFVLHKRPELAFEIGLGRVNPILAALGFSYAVLR